MKRNESYVLNKDDKKAIQLFAKLGMQKNVAKTLMYLSHVNEGYSADIEFGANLRQPEVSIAMRELRQKKWIKMREYNEDGKGRPRHFYKPKTHLSEIINAFEKEKLREIKEIEENIIELKNLIERR